jgi:hypothetical protein
MGEAARWRAERPQRKAPLGRGLGLGINATKSICVSLVRPFCGGRRHENPARACHLGGQGGVSGTLFLEMCSDAAILRQGDCVMRTFQSIQEAVDFITSNERQAELEVCVSLLPSKRNSQSLIPASAVDDDRTGIQKAVHHQK